MGSHQAAAAGRHSRCLAGVVAHGLLDIFYPPYCAACDRRIFAGALCPECRAALQFLPPDAFAGLPFRAAAAYRDPLTHVIHRFKYQGQSWLAPWLAELMAGALDDGFLGAFDCLAPVPLHPARRRERGFNQAQLLARRLASLTGLDVNERALVRVRATRAQADLSGRARLANVTGAFCVRRPARIRGARILLVDDVVTTGATLRACAEAFLDAGAARAGGLALARAG